MPRITGIFHMIYDRIFHMVFSLIILMSFILNRLCVNRFVSALVNYYYISMSDVFISSNEYKLFSVSSFTRLSILIRQTSRQTASKRGDKN